MMKIATKFIVTDEQGKEIASFNTHKEAEAYQSKQNTNKFKPLSELATKAIVVARKLGLPLFKPYKGWQENMEYEGFYGLGEDLFSFWGLIQSSHSVVNHSVDNIQLTEQLIKFLLGSKDKYLVTFSLDENEPMEMSYDFCSNLDQVEKCILTLISELSTRDMIDEAYHIKLYTKDKSYGIVISNYIEKIMDNLPSEISQLLIEKVK